jgi:hypothetical protein
MIISLYEIVTIISDEKEEAIGVGSYVELILRIKS